MKYENGRITMEMFVFSIPVKDPEELRGWKEWFDSRDINSIIHRRPDGRYQLLREGKEANTDMPCYPVEGPCMYCGKPPPHAFGYYKFCDEVCRRALFTQKRRAYEGYKEEDED